MFFVLAWEMGGGGLVSESLGYSATKPHDFPQIFPFSNAFSNISADTPTPSTGANFLPILHSPLYVSSQPDNGRSISLIKTPLNVRSQNMGNANIKCLSMR